MQILTKIADDTMKLNVYVKLLLLHLSKSAALT